MYPNLIPWMERNSYFLPLGLGILPPELLTVFLFDSQGTFPKRNSNFASCTTLPYGGEIFLPRYAEKKSIKTRKHCCFQLVRIFLYSVQIADFFPIQVRKYQKLKLFFSQSTAYSVLVRAKLLYELCAASYCRVFTGFLELFQLPQLPVPSLHSEHLPKIAQSLSLKNKQIMSSCIYCQFYDLLCQLLTDYATFLVIVYT